MEFSLMPDTASMIDSSWGMPTLFEDCSDNFESIVSPGAAMLLLQDLTFRPAPVTFESPPTKPLISVPAETSRASLQRPESQEDWEAKKEILRRLYMDENMPLKDLMMTMSSKYSFSATERMYKRQFLKWNWKKYNTKTRQQSHANGELSEARCGKPTCKRPTRRRAMGLVNQARNPPGCRMHRGSRFDRNARPSSSFPTLMLFSDQCQRWTEELYASARDLIYGSARQSAAWRECSKFDWLWPEDNDLLSQFELAYKTLEKGDFPMYGAMIRQAFRTVDTIVEEESCIIVRKLLLDIPWVLSYDDRDKELLQVYLRHVYQMLIAKKPREPIGAMAKTMHAILLESPAQFSHLLEQLHSAIADYFTATGGCDDLISLCARQDALVIRSDNEVTPSEVESILESFSNLSDEAIGLFGEDSPTAVEIECKRITTMQHLRYWNSFEHLCESLIRRLQATNGILWDDWDPSDLDDVAFTLRSLAKFYDHTDNFDRYILCLRECICMLNYIAEEYGNLWGCGARAVQYGMELMEALTEHDRLQEASQVRLDVAGSKYLREVMENDLECKSLEI